MTDRLSEVSGVVYGIHLRGRLPAVFAPYLLAARGDPAATTVPLTVTFRTVRTVPEVEEIWVSQTGEAESVERLALFRVAGGFGLRFTGEDRGLVRCTRERIELEWSAAASAAPHGFFAYVLPLWLELCGVPVLHGSAVTVAGRAVGFLGPSGIGKSVLCAELLRLGCGFVADDGLALEPAEDGGWCCLDGPPMMRLWPSGLAGRLDVAAESLPRVREGGDKRRLPLRRDADPGGPPAEGLLASPSPATGSPSDVEPYRHALAALYVLERRADPDGPVRLTACAPREALVRLVGHGVAAAPAAVLGLAERRLERLAEVAETVPVRRLGFPSGIDSAESILRLIERDLRDLEEGPEAR